MSGEPRKHLYPVSKKRLSPVEGKITIRLLQRETDPRKPMTNSNLIPRIIFLLRNKNVFFLRLLPFSLPSFYFIRQRITMVQAICINSAAQSAAKTGKEKKKKKRKKTASSRLRAQAEFFCLFLLKRRKQMLVLGCSLPPAAAGEKKEITVQVVAFIFLLLRHTC